MSQYRLFAKAAAYLDLLMTSNSILMIILATLTGTGALSLAKDTNSNLHQLKQNSSCLDHPAAADVGLAGLVKAVIFWALCVYVAIWTIITVLQMCAAIRLLSATEIGREPAEALELASTWWFVSLGFFLLGIIGLPASGTYLVFSIVAIHLILRAGMAYVVFQYMQELEMQAFLQCPLGLVGQRQSTA